MSANLQTVTLETEALPKLSSSFQEAGYAKAWNLMSVDLPQQGLRKCAFFDNVWISTMADTSRTLERRKGLFQ